MPRRKHRVVVDLTCGVHITSKRAADIVRYALNKVDWDVVCAAFPNDVIEAYEVKQGERVMAATTRRMIEDKVKTLARPPVRDKT